ncbi:MAG: hypothetical protein A2452_10745 [Candidatus Firestonebacteria bacterium RIFOXYC2_FULL_39_67]|nr:MAG: hypothetical protein A2536_01220 [Candidatus Firestonebacteria bacterium RIFOXYD2_FULL_39_29]OGF54168.1 MAG: hypothetical protein A2452_10745 [Candidatus Firestonebacteria bacterium RIFOXYC2_FULL_39_67]OGF57199.1 MAG: hypothetical protein A2497_05115 [Candidatus Firestonebacteria bacterium RifOxyC12_full_39_7]
MKRTKMLVLGAAVCMFVSGMLLAEEGAKQGDSKAPGGKGPREIKTDCPECQGIVDQIKSKREELNVLMEKAKPMHEAEKAKRDAEKQAKLDELKQKDPKKYEEVIAKKEEKKKEMEEKKEEKKEGKDGEKREGRKGGKERPKMSPEQMEKMKTENPELYKIMTERDAKQKELQTLREQLKECEKKNKKK